MILFSLFSHLFVSFLQLFARFSASLIYVLNFYKLAYHLQWGIPPCFAGGKISADQFAIDSEWSPILAA